MTYECLSIQFGQGAGGGGGGGMFSLEIYMVTNSMGKTLHTLSGYFNRGDNKAVTSCPTTPSLV